MDLIQLLELEKFDFKKKVKLIRHTREGGVDIEELYKDGSFLDYQSVQTQNIFGDCDIVLAFLATENTKAKYIGSYEVTGISTVGEVRKIKKLPEFGIKDFYKDNQYYYYQHEASILEDLKNRLIIDWGKVAIQYCQKISAKEVVEILPKGYNSEFPGFEDIILDFDDLKEIVDNVDANREWHRMLASVAGVYLILDKETGLQYIGSASGKDGILGRWRQYSKDCHGGNKILKELLEQYPQRYKKFQYSILRTLPRTLTNTEVIAVETTYKKKLGSRAFGLNSN